MKIVIAPDGFKGSLSARAVCEAVAAGLKQADPEVEVVEVPIADGGDGTTEVLVEGTQGRLVEQMVIGPLGMPVQAVFGILGDARTAIIEMATASGLALLPPKLRNPLNTNTYGVGQLIQAALDHGCRDFIIGVGGSATNDAGAGVAQALGAKFFDTEGKEITRVTGRTLRQLGHIDTRTLDSRLEESGFRVACDVKNPLYGPEGAAYVYGPQKGATPEALAELDEGLQRFAELVQRELGKEVGNLPGAGAAGGLAAGLVAFCDAELGPGAEVVLDTIGLREIALGAALLITGEGRLDSQTPYGKGPAAVAHLGRELGIPVVAIAGAVTCTVEELETLGLAVAWSCSRGPESLEEAMEPTRARQNLELAGYNLTRTLRLGGRVARPE